MFGGFTKDPSSDVYIFHTPKDGEEGKIVEAQTQLETSDFFTLNGMFCSLPKQQANDPILYMFCGQKSVHLLNVTNRQFLKFSETQ